MDQHKGEDNSGQRGDSNWPKQRLRAVVALSAGGVVLATTGDVELATETFLALLAIFDQFGRRS